MVYLLCIIFFFGYIYEDSDSLLIINDSLVICGYHRYNLKVHLANNAKLKVRQWNGADSAGKIILQVPFIHIHNSIIEGNGKGYSGGTNTHPNGYGPGCGRAGAGGYGGYGDGEDGSWGTIFLGPLVTREESFIKELFARDFYSVITKGRLKVCLGEKQHTLLIYAGLGRLKKITKTDDEIDVSDFESGIYFLKLKMTRD